MKIWLDDIRDPNDEVIKVIYGSTGKEIWCKTAQEAIVLLNSGYVTDISFDHDLGTEDTGYTVAKHIEKLAHDKKISKLNWRVHSSNPVGSLSIFAAMDQAEKFWNS